MSKPALHRFPDGSTVLHPIPGIEVGHTTLFDPVWVVDVATDDPVVPLVFGICMRCYLKALDIPDSFFEFVLDEGGKRPVGIAQQPSQSIVVPTDNHHDLVKRGADQL